MPIKAKKLFNPVGSITLTVVTLGDNNQPQEETLTFQHKIVTAGEWAGMNYSPPAPVIHPLVRLPLDENMLAFQQAQEEEKAKAEADRLSFLLNVKPDDLTDEQVAEVVSRTPIVEEVFGFLIGWDVVDENDKPLPITLRNLLKMDVKLLKEMSREHFRVTFPNSTT